MNQIMIHYKFIFLRISKETKVAFYLKNFFLMIIVGSKPSIPYKNNLAIDKIEDTKNL